MRDGEPVNLAIAIGPEGGWTDAEFAAGLGSGFAEAALGVNILRTETAVCAALAAAQYAFGAFRQSDKPGGTGHRSETGDRMSQGMSETSKERRAAWNPNLYDAKHAFVWKYGADLISLLAPQAGERILDIGCGTGHLTAQIADSGATVVGTDRSAEMVNAARREYPHLQFEVADARDLRFRAEFDAVFSNATLHWIHEPERRDPECVERPSAARTVRRGIRRQGEYSARCRAHSTRRLWNWALPGKARSIRGITRA